MPNALNYLPASYIGGNTGLDQVPLDIKNIIGAILVPTGAVFTQAQTATRNSFLAALQAATSAATTSRAYPISNFGEVKNESEKAINEKLGYGAELPVRDGVYKLNFRIMRGGLGLAVQLRKLNNQNFDVIFVDANSMFFGTKNVSATGVVTFGGIQLYNTYQMPPDINDGSNLTNYVQSFAFAGNSFDNVGYVQMSTNDLNLILGLQNVTLVSGGARVTNVSKVIGTIGNVGTDLGATYGSALANASYWVVRDSVSGNVIALTGVTYSSATGTYTLTANAADPNYVAANPVTISMAAASVLDAAGYHMESNSFNTPN